MGNELWASPITGYRRRGTRLIELRKIIGSRIIARALYEPLQSCHADAPAWEMLKILKKRDFDVAGVKIFKLRASVRAVPVREGIGRMKTSSKTI